MSEIQWVFLGFLVMGTRPLPGAFGYHCYSIQEIIHRGEQDHLNSIDRRRDGGTVSESLWAFSEDYCYTDIRT